ncbi:MAG: 5-bromo-4-chloroindolyl phosphate hydrolysis family protein [Pikeienuella sp.]
MVALPETLRIAVAVGLGLGAGLLLWFATRLHEAVVLGAALAVFGAAVAVLPRRRAASEISVAPGVSRAELDAALAEGRKVEARIAAAVAGLDAADPAAAEIARLRAGVAAIHAHLAGNPADLSRVVTFRNAHLPRAVAIIEAYVRLAGQPLLDARGRARLDEARSRLPAIGRAFAAQLNALLAHDLDALDAAGRILETSLLLEHGVETVAGLTDAPAVQERAAG